ncbi:MAG: ShlB/FhaC/HecB family hemolysin secretion/activation protein [Denitromonas halophila]|nr:MAG: ShlB/FhaC/HecB family hemolysin secretion/activation protein [Denitromonas halophila]
MTVMNTIFRLSTLSLALAASFPVLAQVAPDAGRVLQQTAPPPDAPRPGPAITIEPPPAAPTQAGGAQVTLQAVSFGGNSVFTEAELRDVLGPVTGQTYDLAGLRTLAQRVRDHYAAAGYPFARAYLPPQSMADGRLRIEVVEGRYGKVQAIGDPALIATADRFLSPLKPGEVIRSDRLERTTLLFDDLPGVKVAPIIRPGQEVGTGDLDVRVERTPGFAGEVGIDNHGNRFTGEHRVRANLQFDSPFLLGDQITARLIYSDENLWLGSLGYSLPLGASGLRGNIGYAHTSYELGKNFASLDATGTAKVSSVGVSYPVIRSQRTNLTAAATYQHKALNDRQGVAGTDSDKSSESIPLALQFDHRDGFGGGGITYGAVSYTAGRLTLDDSLKATDISSGTDARGHFDKWNLDLARVQALPAGFTLFGRVSAQWAGKNLDSSERLSLGGANGVRAYPNGEGNGDEGWLAQIELRYALGAFSPYVFHDAGRVTINADPGGITPAVTDNHHAIAGSGVGVRYQANGWSVDANVAWRSHGGAPQSDSAERDPRAWVTVGYTF